MKLRTMAIQCVAAAFVVAVFASCATAPRALRQSDLDRLADRINSGDVDQLVAGTGAALLVDGEVFHRASDIAYFWQQLVAAGLKVQPPSRTGTDTGSSAFSPPRPVDPVTYQLFSDDFQAKAFFDRYVPKGAALVDATTALGTFHLILAPTGGAGKQPGGTAKPQASGTAASVTPVVLAITGPMK